MRLLHIFIELFGVRHVMKRMRNVLQECHQIRNSASANVLICANMIRDREIVARDPHMQCLLGKRDMHIKSRRH
jgi:hypothetical protein